MITLGSLYTVQESLIFGKPIITIPLLPEQFEISQRLEYLKVGVCCNCDIFSTRTNTKNYPERIGSSIKDCISNAITKFGEDENFVHSIAVDKMKRILKESNGLMKIIAAIENSIMSQNSLFLKREVSKFPMSMIEQIDVYMVFGVIIYFLTSAISALFKLIFGIDKDHEKKKIFEASKTMHTMGSIRSHHGSIPIKQKMDDLKSIDFTTAS